MESQQRIFQQIKDIVLLMALFVMQCIDNMKNKIIILFTLLITCTFLKAQNSNDTCWVTADSIEEALRMKDSCKLHLTINEYTTIDINSTFVVDKKLSECSNVILLGIATHRYLKIEADLSKLTKLEEFGIVGRIRKNVVNKTIRECKNLQRVEVAFHDSSYVFPNFLDVLDDSIMLLLTYHVDINHNDRLLKNLVQALKRIGPKYIRVDALKDINWTIEEFKHNRHFRKLKKIVLKRNIQLYLFGIILKRQSHFNRMS